MKKSYINKLNREELVTLLTELSKLNKENKAFLESKINSNYKNSYDIYCDKITKAFCCFELMNLKKARQAILDFKKTKPDNNHIIELCIHYIKTAYDLEKKDWRLQENFYSAIENIFQIIANYLKENEALKKKYIGETSFLIESANEGWQHREILRDMFKEILK